MLAFCWYCASDLLVLLSIGGSILSRNGCKNHPQIHQKVLQNHENLSLGGPGDHQGTPGRKRLKMDIAVSPVWGHFWHRFSTLSVTFSVPRRFWDHFCRFVGGLADGCVFGTIVSSIWEVLGMVKPEESVVGLVKIKVAPVPEKTKNKFLTSLWLPFWVIFGGFGDQDGPISRLLGVSDRFWVA